MSFDSQRTPYYVYARCSPSENLRPNARVLLAEQLVEQRANGITQDYLQCSPRGCEQRVWLMRARGHVCEPIAGTYQPLYIPVSGNCGPITAMRVPLDGGVGGVKIHQEMQFGRDIYTEVVHKGCILRVTQQVYQQGVLESTMSGPELAVHSSKELSGQVASRIHRNPAAAAGLRWHVQRHVHAAGRRLRSVSGD